MENKETPIKLVSCPTCNKQVEWNSNNPWRPFCSERCRLIDLGEWASENNRIPETTPPDFVEHDPNDNNQ